MNKKIIIFISIIVIAIFAVAGYYGFRIILTPNAENPETPELNIQHNGQIACTMEAKQCPDGSYISRTGPNCEFAACPGEIDISNWQTYRNEEYGFEMKYPMDWLSKECNYVIFFDDKQLSECEPEKMIGRISIQGGLSLTAKESLIKTYTDSREMVNFEKESYLIDGQQAIRISGLRHTWDRNTGKESTPNYINVVLFGKEDNNNFEIQYYEKNKDNQYLNIFNQILSTFKFTK